ncbi:hypothetical protein H4S01_000536 [Coemansia sp. RSA 2610]|nr:hypothetical protein H4S01_000536 [Coemansia sp. RSA 2610]
MLSADQIQIFCRTGYLIVPDFLAADEIKQHQDEAELLTNHCCERGDLVAQWGCVVEPLGCGYFDHSEIPADARSSRTEYLRIRAQISSSSLAARVLDRFGACARQLLADASQREVVLLNEQYIVKPPRSTAEFAWHQDVLYFSQTQRQHSIVSVWTPLCDVSSKNGTVLIDPYPDPTRPGEYPAQPASSPIAVTLAAGSALFMDGRLRHCSTENTTSTFRTVYMPQFSLGAVAAGSELAALAVPVDQ